MSIGNSIMVSIKPIRILWRDGEPLFMFNGHNMDFKPIASEIEVRQKEKAIQYRRRAFHHHSVGLAGFKSELKEAIDTGKGTDYHYNGEDEYQVDVFYSDNAVNAVMRILKDRGLLKYIK